MKPGDIPISDAAEICKKRGCAYVVVFGVREDGNQFHVTTYGMTKKLCKLAGAIGDQIADAILDGRVHPPETEPFHSFLHASAPPGCKCADCTMDEEPCPTCYAVGWKKKHPNTHQV